MISPRIESILLDLGIAPDVIVARNLPECTEASELEVAEIGVDGREYLLIPAAASAWKSMKAVALADGTSRDREAQAGGRGIGGRRVVCECAAGFQRAPYRPRA
jgi:hypothetical protein